MIKRLETWLSPLASLRLTVTLFAFSIGLIFAGTLAQADEGTWTVVDSYFRSPVAWIDPAIFFPEAWVQPEGMLPRGLANPGFTFPWPGGMVLGVLLLVNLLAAHVVRWKLSWRRAGIIVIHAGVLLLLVSEMATAAFSVEGQMAITEGETVNYVRHIRESEFYVLEPRGDRQFRHTVVADDRLTSDAGVIADARLPFEVRVDQWLNNSRLVAPDSPDAVRNLANRGLGREVGVELRPPAPGTGDEVNAPSAYVTLSANGRELGTWLVSLWLDRHQMVTVNGRPYLVGLRFKRTYKDYRLHLIDFSHDKFTGTDKPRNFSSEIQLVDPRYNVDREVKIWMNNPLFYHGETFYQSGFRPDNTGTVLQVVRNPAWWVPYVSCLMVGGGMLFHFGLQLVGYTRRRLS